MAVSRSASSSSCTLSISVFMSTTPMNSPRRPVTATRPPLSVSTASSASCSVASRVTVSCTSCPALASEPRARIRSPRRSHLYGRFCRSSISSSLWVPLRSLLKIDWSGSSTVTVGKSAMPTSRTRVRLRRLRAAPAPTKPETKSSAGLVRIASGVSNCAMCECSRSTAIRSPSLIASSKSWVTNTIVLCSSCWSRISSSWRWSRVIGSTAPNGSSIRSTGGSAASARATPTRCCCPPESWRG